MNYACKMLILLSHASNTYYVLEKHLTLQDQSIIRTWEINPLRTKPACLNKDPVRTAQ
jgi:hypothetical protein